MAHAGRPCPLCKTPLAAKQLPEALGEQEPMQLALRDLPVLECEKPHRHFVGQEFPMWLLNALLEGELARIPAGTDKGLVFRKHTCGGCGAELPSSAAGARTFSAALSWKDSPGFTVDITVPLHRCDRCGRDQARSAAELAKLLPAALAHAFQGAGIKPG